MADQCGWMIVLEHVRCPKQGIVLQTEFEGNVTWEANPRRLCMAHYQDLCAVHEAIKLNKKEK
jgi:hypothetical protein